MTSIHDVVTVFRKWLYLPSLIPLYAALGTAAGNRLQGEPVWLMLVGAPSSGKTELLMSLKELPEVRVVGTLSEGGLLSGTSQKERALSAQGGLLKEIGDFGQLIVKDFTSVLSMAKSGQGPLLAALREIYDGHWTRTVGTDGGQSLAWSGKLGLVAACTDVIDSHYSVVSSMGERFVFCRMPTLEDDRACWTALEHRDQRTAMRADLSGTVGELFSGLEDDQTADDLDQHDKTRLAGLARLAAKARSHVQRDSRSRAIVYVPESEAPPRLILVLAQLLRGMRTLDIPAQDRWSVLRHIAVSSMPSARRRVFDCLTNHSQALTRGEVETASRLPGSTAQRALEDLHAHGLITPEDGGSSRHRRWSLAPWVADLLEGESPKSIEGAAGSLSSTPTYFSG